MEDELEDRIFYQTYVSHMKILSKFILGLGGSGAGGAFTSLGSSTAMAYLWRLCRVYLVRPEVLIGAMVIFLLMVYMQAVEVWTRGFVDRVWHPTRSSARKIDLSLASPAEKYSWEKTRDVSAVYSIKGRRATMEDRFILDENINNNTGISIFAIFDGHGGEFAADYAKDVLIQNVYNKIVEAHNIITGKVDPNRKESVVEATLKINGGGGGAESEECKVGEKKGGGGGEDGTAAAAATKDDLEQVKRSPKPGMTVTERRNSFRKTTSFTDDSIKKQQQPDPLDIYKLNSLVRPLTKDDFLLGGGAGGQANGVKVAPKSLEAKCYISDGKINFGKLLTDEVLAADHKLVETVKKMTSFAGTTAIIAIAEGTRLVVANVGDSRGVMCDSRGNAIPLSFDHKPQQVRERKRIHEAGGFIAYKGVWRVAGILATSRALGDYPLKESNLVIADPDILTFNLNDHKPRFLIFASDGLWDTFSNEEAVSFIKDRLKEPHFGAKSITLQSYLRGSTDNITVMVIVFNGKSFKIGSSTGTE